MPKETIKWDLLVQWGTKIRQKQMSQAYAYNINTVAWTFNGIACAVSTGASLASRWSFKWFSSANNANNVAFYNCEIPDDYVAGRNIKVEIHFTYSSATAWNIVRWIGLQRAWDWVEFAWDTGDILYNETTWVWLAHTVFDSEEHSYTFTGTNFLPGDKVSIIVYRNTTTWNPDTLWVTAYINQVSIYTV